MHDDPDSKTEFVFIRVTDVNEKPEFDEGTTWKPPVSVAADAEVGEPCSRALVKATDPDDDGLTYTSG